MSIVTSVSSRKFVKAATLPPRPRRIARALREPPVELNDTDAQALVVGSSLVLAAEGVPAQTRSDIINCTLFAQLAASGSVTDPTNVAEWYAAYFNALTAIGFAQHDSRFEEFETKGADVEAHKSIISVLTLLLGPAAAAVTLVTETLNALQSMDENSPWITLFNQQSTSVKSARFQVATAQRSDAGTIEIALVAFDLRTRVSITQVLFFKFKSNSTKLKYARGNATIYEATLAESRDAIAARLADYRASYIGAVKFPPKPSSLSVRKRAAKD